MSLEEIDREDALIHQLHFQRERICILEEIIASQKRLLLAYEDEVDLLREVYVAKRERE